MAAPQPSPPEMTRLLVGAPAVVDLQEEAIDCEVERVAGAEATLRPVSAADAAYIPTLGRSAGLVFEDGGTRVRIPGAVHRAEEEGLLRFAAGLGADLPRRRQTARVGVEMAVDLTPLTPAGEPAGDAMRLLTADVSLGGMGVRAAEWAPATQSPVRFSIELAAAPPVVGVARVMRVHDGIVGLQFSHIAPSDLAKLARVLIASRAA